MPFLLTHVGSFFALSPAMLKLFLIAVIFAPSILFAQSTGPLVSQLTKKSYSIGCSETYAVKESRLYPLVSARAGRASHFEIKFRNYAETVITVEVRGPRSFLEDTSRQFSDVRIYPSHIDESTSSVIIDFPLVTMSIELNFEDNYLSFYPPSIDRKSGGWIGRCWFK